MIIFPISREEYLQVYEIWLDCAVAHSTKEGALEYWQSTNQIFRPWFPSKAGQFSVWIYFLLSLPHLLATLPCKSSAILSDAKELTLDMEEEILLYKKITQYLQCLFHSKFFFLSLDVAKKNTHLAKKYLSLLSFSPQLLTNNTETLLNATKAII